MAETGNGAARLIALAIACAALPGCDTVLSGLVGKPRDANGPAQPAGPPLPPPATAFVGDSQLTPNFAGPGVLPPTLSMDDADGPDTDAAEPPSGGPHHPIAVVPFVSDSAPLAPLAEAASRAQTGPAQQQGRFVLLVLAPPASDAATLDRTTALSRLAAAAAIRVLGNSGIGADRIQVSLATSPEAGPGEMRLYQR